MSMSIFLVRLYRLIVIASLLIVGGALLSWALDNRPPITILSAAVEDGEIEQGGTLVVDYRLEQHRRCLGDLQRWIVDSRNVIHFIEIYAPAPELAGVNDFRVSIPIPYGATLGPARYQAMLRYRCNPLQRLLSRSIEVATPPVDFTVLPRAMSG